ncbi:MAG: glycoside hydrolase family 130 protein [Sedimentisphaerales bacterium]|nr:glycoside hydrolase family 130 protein [Sedimentisphaerales bacterium]
MPWQDRPADCNEIMWRYSKNPVIDVKPIPVAQAIYNSAVVPYQGRFAGVFRTEYRDRMPHLHFGTSPDGVTWNIEHEEIRMACDDSERSITDYAYDPRVCKIEDTYYVTWCNGYHGPTIGIAQTKDFKHYERLENAFLPFNRNGVLFPRKINGNFAMLSRPSDNGHTPFGDIFYSESPDMEYWGRHRYVMGHGGQWWQRTKIGAGPIPIETKEGWLLIYHGVITQCNGFVYSVGAALLDLEQPWKVLYRTNQHILTPEEDYECVGLTPNVVFPCAALCDAPSGRIAVYYGAADTTTCLAFTQADELIAFTRQNSKVF